MRGKKRGRERRKYFARQTDAKADLVDYRAAVFEFTRGFKRGTRDLSEAALSPHRSVGERESHFEKPRLVKLFRPRTLRKLFGALLFAGKFRREFHRSFRECGKERSAMLPAARRHPPPSSDEYTRGCRTSLRNRPFWRRAAKRVPWKSTKILHLDHAAPVVAETAFNGGTRTGSDVGACD